MSEEYLISQAAPTLAGLKTGNLFPCCYSSWSSLLNEIRAVNRLLSAKGLCLIPLRHRNNRALLYLYRPAELERDLMDSTAREVLREAGYRCESCAACVRQLVERFHREGEFPHEIGLFLSYPPEDVRGFMEHAGRGCKCVGCWKVYGDEQKARNTFRAYKHCTDCYRARGAMGTSLERLAVAEYV